MDFETLTDWLDDAQDINDAETVDVAWTVVSADGTVTVLTDFTLTAEQARAALRAIAATLVAEQAEPESRHCSHCDLEVPWAPYCTNCGKDLDA